MSDLPFKPQILSDEFKHALDVLENTPKSLFITGRAGTGKSTLLQLFRNTTRKKVAVLAPTGVAALNVQGQTIHSFFGFPPRVITPEHANKKTGRRDLRRLYQNLQVLIIDEVSMVRADMLDGIDLFLRVNRENNTPFGGVQVVLFGDLFQLPPVVTKDPVESIFFQEYYPTPYFFSAKLFETEELEIDMLELRKVYRQESRHFLRLLEAVRINELDHDDLSELNERCNPRFVPDEAGYITLCARNATADRINQLALSALTGREWTYLAEVKGQFDPGLYPTDPALRLRVGAQVMFVKNDSIERQFVNGSIGTVVDLGPEKVAVSLQENGKSMRIDVSPLEWELTRYKPDTTGGITTETIGSFRQYPLKLAWAITIHKSQGKTFDRCIVDLGGGAFEHGQLYVALSRCRTLEGLVLKQPIRFQDVITDERIIDFYQQAFR